LIGIFISNTSKISNNFKFSTKLMKNLRLIKDTFFYLLKI
jgi:hypothetical protein